MTSDNEDIRTEADDILRSGLLSILGGHGEVHRVGSYGLELVTWRDLDIEIGVNLVAGRQGLEPREVGREDW